MKPSSEKELRKRSKSEATYNHVVCRSAENGGELAILSALGLGPAVHHAGTKCSRQLRSQLQLQRDERKELYFVVDDERGALEES